MAQELTLVELALLGYRLKKEDPCPRSMHVEEWRASSFLMVLVGLCVIPIAAHKSSHLLSRNIEYTH